MQDFLQSIMDLLHLDVPCLLCNLRAVPLKLHIKLFFLDEEIHIKLVQMQDQIRKFHIIFFFLRKKKKNYIPRTDLVGDI